MIPKEFTAVFGDLAIKFAHIEFMVGQVLYTLINPGLPAVGGLLTSRVDLRHKLEKIRELAHLRFCHNPDVEERIRKTIQEVDKLRETRNSFVHGQWILNEADLANGVVKCLDTRWKPVKGKYEWVGMKETIHQVTELERMSRDTGQLVLELGLLVNDVSQAKMIGANDT